MAAALLQPATAAQASAPQRALITTEQLKSTAVTLPQFHKTTQVATKAAVSALSDLFGWKNDDSANTAQATSDAIGTAVDNQSDLTKEVKKTNDEVKRGLASFDRLNVISQSGGNSSDDDSGGIDNPLADSFGDSISANVDLNTDDANKKVDELKAKFKALEILLTPSP